MVVVARQDYAHDRIDRDLDLIDVATGARRTLTFERTGLGSPRWSPAGDRLAFVAADGDHHGQIWVMAMSGGDAHRITSTAEGVEQFAWRPSGDSIAFVTSDPGAEEAGPRG